MKVTAEMLRQKKACERQVLIFEDEWPGGADVTEENILRAEELHLSIPWFIDAFFSYTQESQLRQALAEIDKQWEADSRIFQDSDNLGTDALNAYLNARKQYDQVYHQTQTQAICQIFCGGIVEAERGEGECLP